MFRHELKKVVICIVYLKISNNRGIIFHKSFFLNNLSNYTEITLDQQIILISFAALHNNVDVLITPSKWESAMTQPIPDVCSFLVLEGNNKEEYCSINL